MLGLLAVFPAVSMLGKVSALPSVALGSAAELAGTAAQLTTAAVDTVATLAGVAAVKELLPGRRSSGHDGLS